MSIFVHPTADIHLLLGTPTPIQLRVLYEPQPGVPVVDVAPTLAMPDFTIVTTAGGLLTPTAVGVEIGRVIHTDAARGIDAVGLIRVSVHDHLTDLWFASDRMSIWPDESAVPTVHASFDDLAVGDVTHHPYLTFSAPAAAPFTIDPASGMITAGTSAGAQDQIEVTAPGVPTRNLTVRIRQSLTTTRPILWPVHYAGRSDDKVNLLVLAEGYRDPVQFENHLKELTKRLFESPSHSPYKHLRDSMNVWAAFEESPSTGITVGPAISPTGRPIPFAASGGPNFDTVSQLIDMFGLPGPGSPVDFDAAKIAWAGRPGFDEARLAPQLFNEWAGQTLHGLLRAKDSTLGLMMGQRLGLPQVVQAEFPTPAPPVPLNAFLRGWIGHQIPGPDPRRYPAEYDPGVAKLRFLDVVSGYVRSLRYGTDPSHPDHDISRHWVLPGKDAGLVAVLVFENHYGGAQWEVPGSRKRIAFSVCMGNDQAFRLTGTAPRLDHETEIRRPLWDTVTGKIAHESAHAFGLGDEYENIDSVVGNDELPGARWEEADDFDNLTHWANIVDSTGLIPARIKWNWDRIAKASPVFNEATSPATGDVIEVQLAPGEGLKWRAVETAHQEVFLRNPDLNPQRTNPMPSTSRRSRPLTIESMTGDNLVLRGDRTQPRWFPAGSVLYLPKRNKANDIRTVIDADVRQKLFEDGRAFGAHAAGRIPCTQSRRDPDLPPKNIPGFSHPRDRANVIAIFEGGGRFNCQVFRPAGTCKMRQEEFNTEDLRWWVLGFLPFPHNVKVTKQRGFCFVCKYLIVNRINPAVFDLLDREYPEDC